MSKKAYDASSIQTLNILDAVRKTPGMYIGSADNDGVEVILREVIDNSIDEFMNGHGREIWVHVDPVTGWMGVEDQGRGIPVEEHHQHKGVSTLEAVLTRAHTGGKFASEYGVTGGLHGTGLKAMTALSAEAIATVWRDGEHTLAFSDAKTTGKIKTAPMPKERAGKTGTRIQFRLDGKYLPDATALVPPRDVVQRLLRERAYLNTGLKLHLKYGAEKVETFKEADGIASYVRDMTAGKRIFDAVPHLFNEKTEEIGVEVALGWTSAFGRDNTTGYCNCIRQSEGGTHVQGLRIALPGVVRKYIEDNDLIPKKDKDLAVEASDCFDGVYAIVSIKHKAPVFKGQHKGKITNGDAQGAVQKCVNSGLAQWLEENPKEAKALSARAIAAAKARIAASKAREQVRKQDAGTFGMKNFGKLKDCSSKDPVKNELFIVEGK